MQNISMETLLQTSPKAASRVGDWTNNAGCTVLAWKHYYEQVRTQPEGQDNGQGMAPKAARADGALHALA